MAVMRADPEEAAPAAAHQNHDEMQPNTWTPCRKGSARGWRLFLQEGFLFCFIFCLPPGYEDSGIKISSKKER